MRATSGNSTSRHGYALLMLLLLVGAAGGVASALIPKRLAGIAQDRAVREEAALERIRDGLLQSIQLELKIPNARTWSQAVAKVTGMTKKAVEYVDPKFQGEPGMQRAFLIDPGLASSLLPYTQNDDGLSGVDTNLLGSKARIMIVSTSRRGIDMPVSTDSVTQSQFDTLWDWAYNAGTQAPPTGWPADWNKKGAFIHVERIPMRSLFARVTLDSLVFGLGPSSHPGNGIGLNKLVPGSGDYWFLKGSMIHVAKSLVGGPQMTINLQQDDAFSFSDPETLPTPLAFYPFRTTSQSTIVNEGSLGAAWNGTCYYSAWAGSAGPRSPTFPGFSATNQALNVSSSSALVYTTGKLPLKLPAFTLAGWIRPESISSSQSPIFGIRDALQIGIRYRYWRYYIYGDSKRGGTVAASYPYSLNTWHHVAFVGDGTRLKLYLDGVLVASRRKFISNYSFLKKYSFRISDVSSWHRGRFDGLLDEIVLLDKALSDADIKTLSEGRIAEVCNVSSGS